jgi:hypothetical protein
MAIAEELGVIALGALWWDAGYINDTTRTRAALEIARQGAFLASAWDSEEQELLIGIGDQINKETGQLWTYSDFAEAQRALAIGPPSEEDNSTLTTVRPTCSFASPKKPAADVAAHSAAALALGSMAARNLTGDATLTEGWLEAAAGMLKWSTDLTRQKQPGEVTEVVNTTSALGKQDFGVRCLCHSQTNSFDKMVGFRN